MKNVIGAFETLLVLMINLFFCITVGSASASVAAAKEYKADVIAEIENSNFNAFVIEGCIEQANKVGYQLEITDYVYDENYDIRTAEVILKYTYQLPLFGISISETTRGIAR